MIHFIKLGFVILSLCCALLPGCKQQETLDTSNAETILDYDARLDVKEIYWVADNVIAFTAQDTSTKWETLYTISPEGELLWKWDENSTYIRQHSLSRFEAGLRVNDVPEGRALTLQADGTFDVEEIDAQEANAPYKITERTDKFTSEYSYSYDLGIEIEKRTNRDTGVSTYFASNSLGDLITIGFSAHTNDNTCCLQGFDRDLQLINGGTAMFSNRSTTSSQFDHHRINDLPFEFFVINQDLDHEILQIKFQEGIPRTNDYKYSGAGILIARDGSLTGRVEEKDAGIWSYYDGSWVRLYVGSVANMTVNPFDMCSLAFTTPTPNRRFSLGLSSKRIRTMNVCEQLDINLDGALE